jgi:hypothetical protein
MNYNILVMEQVEDTQHAQQDKENTGGCPDVDGKRFPGGGWKFE